MDLLNVLMLVAFFVGCVIYAKGLRRMEATIDRMEAATSVVAADLAATAKALKVAADQRSDLAAQVDRMETATHVVADNLAASTRRADQADATPGAAADAALRPEK